MLTTVTLTGADDSVHPLELRELSIRFPFVEWGILIGSRNFVPRFPSLGWFERLTSIADNSPRRMNLSLHLCGRILRRVMSYALLQVPVDVPLQHFSRVQLNFHGDPINGSQAKNIARAFRRYEHLTPIVQLDGVNNHVLEDLRDMGLPIAQGLHDCSHGAGVLPKSWPEPDQRFEIGYAGGLGPDNVACQVEAIERITGPYRYWIDMETKLRSDSDQKFDIEKCRSVLAACEPLIGK